MMVVPQVDPLEGQRYVKLVNDEWKAGYLDNIYNISSTIYDYINPTTDGKLSWKSVSSCSSDSGEALENWQNWFQEVLIRKCATIIEYS